MTILRYSILALFAACIGIILFAYYHGMIIIQYPRSPFATTTMLKATKKSVKLIYWHQGQWHTQTEELLWHNDQGQNIQYLINSWLTLLDDEQMMSKKVTLQSVLIAQSDTDVYLSFDRNPLGKEQSIFEKWMFVEGLLKTIRDNDVPVQQVQFLVHHQPVQDAHLDFSKPWPVSGFL